MRNDLMGLACAGAFLLVACGGGGDPAPAPSTPPPATQLKDYHQVYLAFDSLTFEVTGMVAVKVADFAQRTPLGAAAVSYPLFAGTRVGNVIREFRPHSLYYVQGGMINRADLRSGTPGATRVSNESLTEACSFAVLQPSFGDATGASVLYSEPGLDATCETGDDEFRRVGITDGPGVTPLAGPDGHALIPFRSADGALTSLLTYHFGTGELKLYPASLSGPTPVGIGSAFPLVRDNESALFAFNGTIVSIDAVGDMSGPLHTVAGSVIQPDGIADDNFFYFVDGPDDGSLPQLYRVALDGLTPAEPLWAPPVDELAIVGETAQSILLATFEAGTGGALLRLDKATDGTFAPAVLLPLPDIASTFDIHVTQPMAPVLFNIYDANGSTAYRVSSSDVLTSRPTAEWIGRQYPVDYPLADLQSHRDFPPTGAFRIDDFDIVNGHHGGTVRLHDNATGQTRTLTTLDQPGFIFADAIGSVGMAAIFDGSYDVLSFDLDTGRIERHTNATPAHEVPYVY